MKTTPIMLLALFYVLCLLFGQVISPTFHYPSTSFLVSTSGGPEALSPSPHGEADNRKTVCSFPSWRDKVDYLDYVGFAFYLSSTMFNWYIIVCYDTEDRKQSYIYLLSLTINLIPACLFPTSDSSTWAIIKVATGYIICFICLGCHTCVYYHFGHHWWNIAFMGLSLAGTILEKRFRDVLRTPLHFASRVTNIVSVLILTCAFLIFPTWDYALLETMAAFLGAVYTSFGFLDACTTTDIVLVSIAFGLRIAYGILLAYNASTKGILLWGPSTLASSGARKFKPLKQIIQNSWKTGSTCAIRYLLALWVIMCRPKPATKQIQMTRRS